MKRCVLLLLIASGCIGGRLGVQWRHDGTVSPYGGPWVRGYGLGGMSTGGDHHLTGGAEADVLWSRASTEGVVSGLGFWAGDPDHQAGYGAMANFGFDFGDGVHFHSALCATNYNLYTAGVCGRWSAGNYVGFDAELGTGIAVAALAPPD